MHNETFSGASIGDDVRVVFASATCPPELHELAEGIVDGSHLHYVQTKNIHTLMRHVQQKFIRTRERDKLSILEELLRVQLSKPEVQTLVFCKVFNELPSFFSAHFSIMLMFFRADSASPYLLHK